MTRHLIHRLAELERHHPAIIRRWHRIVGDTEAELASKAADLRASVEWQEGDGIIECLIADPITPGGGMSRRLNTPAEAGDEGRA